MADKVVAIVGDDGMELLRHSGRLRLEVIEGINDDVTPDDDSEGIVFIVKGLLVRDFRGMDGL